MLAVIDETTHYRLGVVEENEQRHYAVQSKEWNVIEWRGVVLFQAIGAMKELEDELASARANSLGLVK